MNVAYSAQFLSQVEAYITSLPKNDRASIAAHIDAMRDGRFSDSYTKQLSGPIRELIVGPHRFTYFIQGSALYFVSAWRKKSAKTPKVHIELAKKVYKEFK